MSERKVLWTYLGAAQASRRELSEVRLGVREVVELRDAFQEVNYAVD